jgi:hypothetical protein
MSTTHPAVPPTARELADSLRRLARAAAFAGSDQPRARLRLRAALVEAQRLVDRLDAAADRAVSRGLAAAIFCAAVLGWAVVLA